MDDAVFLFLIVYYYTLIKYITLHSLYLKKKKSKVLLCLKPVCLDANLTVTVPLYVYKCLKTGHKYIVYIGIVRNNTLLLIPVETFKVKEAAAQGLKCRLLYIRRHHIAD